MQPLLRGVRPWRQEGLQKVHLHNVKNVKALRTSRCCAMPGKRLPGHGSQGSLEQTRIKEHARLLRCATSSMRVFFDARLFRYASFSMRLSRCASGLCFELFSFIIHKLALTRCVFALDCRVQHTAALLRAGGQISASRGWKTLVVPPPRHRSGAAVVVALSIAKIGAVPAKHSCCTSLRLPAMHCGAEHSPHVCYRFYMRASSC